MVSFYIIKDNDCLYLINCQVVGDITKERTLLPEYFKGVRKVINAASVIVGPKEGDTPERAKYSQVSLETLLDFFGLDYDKECHYLPH